MAAEQKFPNSTWDSLRRAQSIQEQLDDVRKALLVERGELHSDDHAHQNPDHRIAALIADILILAHERGVEIEPHLERVLAWFEHGDERELPKTPTDEPRG
jgi:hypothetical protein